MKQYNAIAQEYLVRLEALPGWAHQPGTEDEEGALTAVQNSEPPTFFDNQPFGIVNPQKINN